MTTWIVLPILIPLVAAVASLLARRRPRLVRAIAILASSLLVLAAAALLRAVDRAGFLVTQVGSWPAPFGITLVADRLSAIMVLLAAIIALAAVLHALCTIGPELEGFGYHPIHHVLLMGVCGSFLTGDLFNLFVWFEVMLVASFVLLALRGERAQVEGAIKYVALNMMASVLFLSATGLLYGATGTLNMADLALVVGASQAPGLLAALGTLLFVAFGIKAAVFPLFFWLPASYHTPPPAVSAVFGGLLTKVGVYALLRVFTLIFVGAAAPLPGLVLVVASLTMITGVLGAVAQHEVRRILSFHIISQIGYMLMGLGLATRHALAGAIFFIAHNILAKTNLFLVSGVSLRIHGTEELSRIGGLYRRYPALSALFLVSALSLAGVPPLSGFFAKLALIQAGLAAGQPVVVGVALAVGLLTLFSMTKIWAAAFWKEPASGPLRAQVPRMGLLLAPIAFLGTLTVATGIFAGPVFDYCLRAGAQLTDPSRYVDAVLGARR